MAPDCTRAPVRRAAGLGPGQSICSARRILVSDRAPSQQHEHRQALRAGAVANASARRLARSAHCRSSIAMHSGPSRASSASSVRRPAAVAWSPTAMPGVLKLEGRPKRDALGRRQPIEALGGHAGEEVAEDGVGQWSLERGWRGREAGERGCFRHDRGLPATQSSSRSPATPGGPATPPKRPVRRRSRRGRARAHGRAQPASSRRGRASRFSVRSRRAGWPEYPWCVPSARAL